jgi:hypothetical protein
MEERERRIGRNEALFREVNERIEKVTQALQVEPEPLRILCECGDQSCVEQIEVSLADYERVRADPMLFFVRSGHEHADVEEIVEEDEGYFVVRKDEGPAADEARKLDPRDNDD